MRMQMAWLTQSRRHCAHQGERRVREEGGETRCVQKSIYVVHYKQSSSM